MCDSCFTPRKATEEEEERKEMEEKQIRLKQVRRQYLTARNTRIRVGKE